jgi:hypothetical protein
MSAGRPHATFVLRVIRPISPPHLRWQPEVGELVLRRPTPPTTDAPGKCRGPHLGHDTPSDLWRPRRYRRPGLPVLESAAHRTISRHREAYPHRLFVRHAPWLGDPSRGFNRSWRVWGCG